MLEELYPIAAGAVTGAVFGYMGYYRSTTTDTKIKWSWGKAAPVIVLSAVGGIVLATQGNQINDVSLASLVNLLEAGGFGLAVERAYKTFMDFVNKKK